MDSLTNIIQAWGLPILGIAVPLAIFVYQTRQSIGAETERRGRANQELADLLVRRLILEDYYPSHVELQKVREGLANKYNVDPESLISNDSLESSVAYSVVANDYIEKSRRRHILERIQSANPPQDRSLNRIQARRFEAQGASSALFELWGAIREFGWSALLAMLGSIIAAGALSLGLDNSINNFITNFGGILGPTLIGGGLTIVVAAGVIRQRNLQKRTALERVSVRGESVIPGKMEARIRALLFEAFTMGKVTKILEGAAARNCDFVIERLDRQRVAIEIKNPADAPHKTMLRWLSGLSTAVEISESALGLLIVSDTQDYSEVSRKYPKVKVIAEAELAGFLDDWAASTETLALKAV